jgi:site-specific recombinase XerD
MGARNRAVILLLLDCGLRISELCSLRIRDYRSGRIYIELGKGGKGRSCPVSPLTVQAIDEYLQGRESWSPDAPLFITNRGKPMDRHNFRNVLWRLGRRLEITKVHPHRFRHTFAITFLRNGGNIYTLQRILGHSTLEMVQRYLHIAQADIDADHARASPVMNWFENQS